MAYFNTDSTGITWTATINSVMCGVAIIPVVVFMDTVKLRVIMLTATGTMGELKCSGFINTVTTLVVGCLIKLVAGDNFNVMLIVLVDNFIR